MAKTPQRVDFKYVDAWHKTETGKDAEWTRVDYPEGLSDYRTNTAGSFNCFGTVQRFTSKTRGNKGEIFIAPLYFDLDYAADPSVSQSDALRLIDFFMQELGVLETDMHIYFSGSKGFHILIDDRVFGIEPGDRLHKVYKHIASYLIHRLDLKALDLVVYSKYRMLRLPNTIHASTRLFKIELSIEEMRNMTLEQIKEKAGQPRQSPVIGKDERETAMDLRPKAGLFYKEKLQEWHDAAATASKRYIDEFVFRKDRPPVCVDDIMEGGWKKEGDRNQATVQLAAYYKEAGFTVEDTKKRLEEWVIKHTSADKEYDKQQRVASTRSVVDSVFEKENGYRFGCAFIRSLHGEKPVGGGEYEKVACAGSLCHCLKKHDIDESKASTMHLSQTGAADLTGELVKTPIMVAGKKQTPYIVPSKVEYYCWGREGCKKTSCPLYDIPSHTLYKDLGVSDPELLEMTATAKDNITGILRQLSGIPSCKQYTTTVEETVNVEELLVVPMAATGKDAMQEDQAGRYVMRQVFTIGQIDVTENKYYELLGYVYPHPKNAQATIMVRDAKPLQDVVESFELTQDIKERLKVLQPEENTKEAIGERLAVLMSDLTYNVTKIVERDEILLGVLLTYHSVLRFSVPWDSNPIRGWLEFKIVGDTGTGKSALIEALRRFIGLGTRINAESTTRTGLTYKMEQAGSTGAWYIVWGAWPLADKELIWIDEDTGIDKEGYGEMTLARSDGRLEVKKAATAETLCRVRGIFSGNVPRGRRLSDYGQGVQSLRDIFNNEDIRRFDFASFMRSDDVDAENYNRQLGTFPSTITGDDLKHSILFSWSRKAENVLFMDGTLDRVLEVSTRLSKIYGNASDVPIVSPSDQRNKVARLSVALASLLHSVDESGERIVVCPAHVDVIEDFLIGIYNAPGAGLNHYARLAVKEEKLTEERYEKLSALIKEVDTLKNPQKFYDFVKLFAQTNYVRQSDLENMLAIERDEAKAIAAKLTNLRMISNTSGGYRKTPRFNAYIQKLFEHGVFDNMEDEYL